MLPQEANAPQEANVPQEATAPTTETSNAPNGDGWRSKLRNTVNSAASKVQPLAQTMSSKFSSGSAANQPDPSSSEPSGESFQRKITRKLNVPAVQAKANKLLGKTTEKPMQEAH